MKIGKLAAETGFTVETIRFYEKSGLLPAATRDALNNYRQYDADHLQRLRFIRNCRVLGMKLDEIRLLLASIETQNNCSPINEVVTQHLLHVQSKIKKLQVLEKELQVLQSKCRHTKQTDDCEILHELYSIYGAAEPVVEVHGAGVCSD